MRLISGIAGGIPLVVPKSVTRPTQDRVRQAIFSMLAEKVLGAKVLDLFAGSGALGLECLSRGASSVVGVESNHKACEVIAGNVKKTKLSQYQVIQSDVFKFLKQNCLKDFDLIFADPPYTHYEDELNWAQSLLDSDDITKALHEEGFFVLECIAGKNTVKVPSSFKIAADREYGSTRILILNLP
jgi:16S rRNA (guanine966-N2)-methyltransferase